MNMKDLPRSGSNAESLESRRLANRKNGRLPSCEQCRRRKVRCDHGQPVCSRCRQMGAHCWYHPAPLTKANRSSILPSTTSDTASQLPHLSPESATIQVGAAQNAPSSSVGDQTPDVNTTERHNPQHVAVICDALVELRHLDLIEKLVRTIHELSRVMLNPNRLIFSAFDDLRELAANISTTNRKKQVAVVCQLLDNTSKTILTPKDNCMASFYAQHLGDNLRLEVLAIIFALAGRASFYALASEAYGDVERIDLIDMFFRCSSTFVRVAKEVCPETHDATIWMQFENTILASDASGDDEKVMTRTHSDMIDDVLAMRLHTDPGDTVPFALAELRRRAYAAVCYLDKMISGRYHLPPRLLTSYSSCKMPLDLPDDLIFSECSETLQQALSRLTSDGWDTQGAMHTATWYRIRCGFAKLKEKTFKYSLRQPSTELVGKLYVLRQRCQQDWNRLPEHVKYTPACWSSGLATTESNIMTFAYLIYLHLNLETSALLIRSGENIMTEHLETAAEILTVILHANGFRDRATYLRFEALGMMLIYGQQAAITLAKALLNSSNSRYGVTQDILPANLSRAALIRRLSVYCSNLESICYPEEVFYAECTQASQAVSRIIDEAIDSPSSSTQYESAGIDSLAVPTTFTGHNDMNNFASNVDSNISPWDTEIDWSSFGMEWTGL